MERRWNQQLNEFRPYSNINWNDFGRNKQIRESSPLRFQTLTPIISKNYEVKSEPRIAATNKNISASPNIGYNNLQTNLNLAKVIRENQSLKREITREKIKKERMKAVQHRFATPEPKRSGALIPSQTNTDNYFEYGNYMMSNLGTR